VTNKPLITKLSPNQTDIRENARRCIEAGSDALAVINTIMGMAIDWIHAGPSSATSRVACPDLRSNRSHC